MCAKGFKCLLRAAARESMGSRNRRLRFLLSSSGSTFERGCGKCVPLRRSRGHLGCLSAFTDSWKRQDSQTAGLQATSLPPPVSWSNGRRRGVPDSGKVKPCSSGELSSLHCLSAHRPPNTSCSVSTDRTGRGCSHCLLASTALVATEAESRRLVE